MRIILFPLLNNIFGTVGETAQPKEMSRAEIRAQMVAMRNSMNTMYKNNSKQGMCEPKFEMPDEGRLSALSVTMNTQLMRSVKKERRNVQKLPVYTGPHIAGFAIDKDHMPTVTNHAHSSNTNNGYARKACGGFYCH